MSNFEIIDRLWAAPTRGVMIIRGSVKIMPAAGKIYPRNKDNQYRCYQSQIDCLWNLGAAAKKYQRLEREDVRLHYFSEILKNT